MDDPLVATIERMGGRLFCKLPTTADIIAADMLNGYLLARTSDDRIWVINEHGKVVTSFTENESLV